MSITAEAQSIKKLHVVWLVACGAISGAILLYGGLGLRSTSSELPRQLVTNFFLAMLIAGPVHFLLFRRTHMQRFWMTFGWMYVALVMSSLLSQVNQKEEVHEAIRDIQASQSGTTPDEPVPAQVSVGEAGNSESSQLSVMIRNSYNRMAKEQQDYQQELEAAGWSRVMDVKNLADDPSLSKTLATIQEAKIVVAKYKGKAPDSLELARRDIEQSALSDENKRSALQGFEVTAGEGLKQANRMWELEEKAVAEVERMFTMLAGAKGHWTIREGQIQFSRDQDLAAFNAHIQEIASIAQRQEQMAAEYQQKLQGLMAKMSR